MKEEDLINTRSSLRMATYTGTLLGGPSTGIMCQVRGGLVHKIGVPNLLTLFKKNLYEGPT